MDANAKRDGGAGRTRRSVVHVDQYRRACWRLHLLREAVLSRRGHALHALSIRRSFVQRPEGWHGDAVIARRRSPSSSPRGRMRVTCQPGKKDRQISCATCLTRSRSPDALFFHLRSVIQPGDTREVLFDLLASVRKNARVCCLSPLLSSLSLVPRFLPFF